MGEARTQTYSRSDLRSFVVAAMLIECVIRPQRDAVASYGPGSQNRSLEASVHVIIEATPRLDPAHYRAMAEAFRTDPVLRSLVRQMVQGLRKEELDALRSRSASTF